ncbi:MAG: VCBS repeat-containing protein [Candidatus Promineifilaceae bacterium]
MAVKIKLAILSLIFLSISAVLFTSLSEAQTNGMLVDRYGRPLPEKQFFNNHPDIVGRLEPPFGTFINSLIPGNSFGLFLPYEVYPGGDWEEAVGIGDFNNDGLNDVATSEDFFTGYLRIYLQNTSGTLDKPVLYDIGSRPSTLAVGDLNNDGRDDVVTANFHDDKIGVFLQKSNGTLASQVTYNTSTGPDAIAVADLNDDGRDDVVVSHWTASNIGVFIQNTNGTLDPIVSYSAPQSGYDDIDTGDLNNDGLIDVVKMNGQGGNPALSVYLQTISGTLSGPISYDHEGGNGVAVGDLTGDGRQDIAFTYGGNGPSANLAVFTQTVTGTLKLDATYSAYDIPEPVEIADVDMDGLQDVVTIHGGWEAMGVFLQQPDGTLSPYELYDLPYATRYGPQGLDLGDINNDGLPDVTIANYGRGLVILHHISHPKRRVYLPLLLH